MEPSSRSLPRALTASFIAALFLLRCIRSVQRRLGNALHPYLNQAPNVITQRETLSLRGLGGGLMNLGFKSYFYMHCMSCC